LQNGDTITMTTLVTPIPGAMAPPQTMDWLARGMCQQVDTELFFPERGGSTREAKSICRDYCPVRAKCLLWALESDQGFGIWGGLSARERRSLRRRAA
jgi:WhiB family transcriptional regulator, redox-sensing transcriptional regulator